MNIKRYISNIDFLIVSCVIALCIFGIISIGSATHINLGESMATYRSQILWFAIGLVLMIAAIFVNYEFLSKFTIFFYLIDIALLIAVLKFGKSVNNATRWLSIGGGTIQPSEFAKIIMIFCLAKIIDKKKDSINNIFVLIFLVLYTALPVFLIGKQPSLSASLVIVAILITEIFVSGLSYKIIAAALAFFTSIVAFVVWDVQKEAPLIVDKILAPHQISRILTFIDPTRDIDSYYQTAKSINAIASGQLSGKGLYQGTLNQLSYLPEPHNDFIFSVIGEEFGFMGCVVILILLLIIIIRCIMIAMASRDKFSQLIASGVAGMLLFQTFVNAGVATGIMPTTGMSLPFVSYGGSSMWANMIAIGLVLNIGRRRSRTLFEGG
ncbi:MAG: rod shape-determining protein RodA [Lachnospiraceae bacterium]|nr:rod shape-determining protein RodA [Lachnospiraceae bacterium]